MDHQNKNAVPTKGDRIRNIATTVVFCLFVGVFSLLCIFHKPVGISESERRELAKFPKITWSSIKSTSFMSNFDKYSMDQFPLRDSFRRLHSFYQLYVVNRKDTNGVAITDDGYMAAVKGSLNEKSVQNVIDKMKMIYDRYLTSHGGDVYFTVVPDKGYFLAEEGYPSIEYDVLVSMMRAGLTQMEYIDIFGELSLEDYYRTDTHWSQDKITGVADKIAEALGCGDRLTGDYKVNSLYPFNGVYVGQLALDVEPDTLNYLTSDILDACTVYDYEAKTTGSIYNFAKFDGLDPYDFFLSGTRAMLRIDNPNAKTDEELVVFRDSFGSSIIPLLAEGYKSIYIVDTRYIAPSLLEKEYIEITGIVNGETVVNRMENDFYLDFTDKDVLFLYSALILNDSYGLKGWNG